MPYTPIDMPLPPDAPEIRTTATREVYRNRWMRVREDTILRPSGAAGIYGVVEKPDFAVVVPWQDGRLTLVEQYRYPVSARYWEFPQGSAPQGETEGAALATAELREETGLVAATIRHVGRLFPSYGFVTQSFDIYLATGLQQQATQLEPEEEGLVCRAFSLAEVERMVVDGIIRDAPTVAALGLLRLQGLL